MTTRKILQKPGFRLGGNGKNSWSVGKTASLGLRNLYQLLSFLLLLSMSNNLGYSQQSWLKKFPGIGTFSSPRITDLNADGVGDIILGAGREEFQVSDSAVVAINGKNGDLMWHVSAKDQIFGSAAFLDINGDAIEDVFIGGRSAQFMAIDGRTGTVIWRFQKPEGQQSEWFNFYNPLFIPDQNDDGQPDILISNGGDILAEPHDPNRLPGYLVILDSRNGKVISRAMMPDGKETYLSVAVLPDSSQTARTVIFGTGGETLGGNLFVTSIAEIRSGDISRSIKLATSTTRGFIGPAVWVDINRDGIHDIVTNAVDGRMLAFDGKTYQPIWQVSMPGTEAYGSMAVGNFTGDDIPDFFTSYAQGKWPDLEWSKQFMVDGKSGKVVLQDSLGFYQMTSPVAVDLDSDGLDEALMPMNYQVFDSLKRKYFYNDLAVIEFSKRKVTKLNLSYKGNNISSTPWVGDLDNNGFMDIIYVHGTNVKQTYTFDGLQVNRIDTDIPIEKNPKWGSYMGSSYNGVFD
ncbi:PQQ-like beta-propeller repeat protein [Flavobacteriaceae bacterium F89]|uniref:PQQ-like beta-propeller repeat protein n=1 Tax=Cerina litoralis TaxID=2874477 RepID=A0AAE3EVH2_9FLAO|nr:PQQ-binding-like beta-propeller repeat protein [Cerina litoralis]MCG2461043.1 PQQ-like beta-propeller repeat protein [Cerina litoralis]